MTVMSTPACSRFIAAVCRRVCALTCLTCSDGQMRAAVAACLATRQATASWDSGVLRRVANRGPLSAGRDAVSQLSRMPAVCAVSGVQRSLRPLPR